MALSAAVRVLRVPELLSRIFSFSTTEDNDQNLLVCKLWSNEVLNIEWKVVTEATHLYHLLAPLETSETGLVRFTRQLKPEDWVRFDRYAWRIKSLNVSLPNFDMSLYSEIAASRHRLDFLPNLRTLTIPAITIAVQLFSHASVTSFIVYPTYTPFDAEHQIKGTLLLSQIRHKMPNLQSLSIDISSPTSSMGEIQSEATLTLRELKRLAYLALPPAWITECVTEAISELPNLHTLDTSCFASADPSDASDDLENPLFSTNLTSSSFLKLTSLLICISYPRAIACLSQAFRLPSLEVLALYATHQATREQLKNLMVIIGSSYPRLTVLKLDGGWMSNWFGDIPQGLGLGFQDIEPLLSCKYLTELRIVQDFPVLLDVSDIVKLLEPLEWLTNLFLNATPPIQSPSALPISCLSSIVSARPSLFALGLYVSTSSSDVPTADPMATFKSLRFLDVGFSKLAKEDVAPVAFYLGHILPRDCEIFSFKPLLPEPVVQGPPSTVQWGKVSRLARMFRQAVDNGEQHILSGLK